MIKEYLSKPKKVRKLIDHISYCKSAVLALKRKHRLGKKNPGYFLDQIKKTEKLLKQVR
jgi:hypothetical protein